MPPAPTIVFRRGDYRGKVVHYRTRHVILKVYSQDDGESAIRSVIDEVMDHVPFNIVGRSVGRWSYLHLRNDADILQLVKDLNQDIRVEYAEPDLIMNGSAEVRDPGDPLLYEGASPQQWGIGYMNLFEVWETQKGNDSVLIGLIDSGVPLLEEEYGRLSLHDRINDVMNHIDLDGSRFITGFNYLYETPEPWPQDEHDLVHGTNMAGIIAAKENNLLGEDFIGTAGVNWGSPVYVSVALDQGNNSTIGFVYMAVEEILGFAANNGNPNVVLNLSINYKDDIDEDGMLSMQDMFTMIVDAGAIICISVGNGGLDEYGILVKQPARMGVEKEEYAPNVIVVGAIDNTGHIHEHSGRGIKDMVFAPGVNIGTTDEYDPVDLEKSWESESGSSVANAHVSGLAALLWSEDPALKASDVVKCIKKTCQFPAVPEGDSEVETEFLSQGIVDANAALMGIRGFADLTSPTSSTSPISLVFDVSEADLDHEQEIKIQVTSCQAVTFSVTTTGHDFGIVPGSYDHDPCSGDPFILVATYAATDDDTESGTVTVIWDQRPTYRWEIGISALRTLRQKSIYLVLDKSGSMASNSGIGAYTRLEVMKYSAGLLVDLIDPGNGLGAVSFNEEAHDLAPFTVIPPENPGPARTLLKTAIETLAAGGLTSIAAGIMAARDHLDSLPDDDVKAIILLTDGRETHEPWLEDLLADENPYPIFAIGMGTAASLQTDALSVLADMTNGYCVLSGDLDDATDNIVGEFLSQILAEICGDSVAFDPTQHLHPGGSHRFPVKLSEVDKLVKVILMRPPGAPLKYRVFGPDNLPLASGKIQGSTSNRLIRFDFPGPAFHRREGFTANGVWHVEISSPRKDYQDWIEGLQKKNVDTRRLELHGAPYTFRVHTRSNLKMRCRVSQSGYSPGSTLFLHVRLTDRDRPLRMRSSVTAQLTDPQGGNRTLRLVPDSAGFFQTQVEASFPGTYHWKIFAEGRSQAGHTFRRECHLTGAVWNSTLRRGSLFPPLAPAGGPPGI